MSDNCEVAYTYLMNAELILNKASHVQDSPKASTDGTHTSRSIKSEMRKLVTREKAL